MCKTWKDSKKHRADVPAVDRADNILAAYRRGNMNLDDLYDRLCQAGLNAEEANELVNLEAGE